MDLSRLFRFLSLPASLAAVCALTLSTAPGATADLQSFSNVRLVPNSYNDGDSFVVEMDGKQHRLRLYFVDCPETTVEATTDAERAREQVRYFGLKDPKLLIQYGVEAKRFVEQALSKPFRVDTAFATAGGRSAGGRIYAFVTTADGDDLARLLVQNGLARAYGVGRQTPDGTSREEQFQRLRDLEVAAAMKRLGIWAVSNPDKIVELRETERTEKRGLQEFKEQTKGAPADKGLIDLNKASKEDLDSLPGIGPVLAERIIAARPFHSVDDLSKVSGIGPKKFEDLRQLVIVQPEKGTNGVASH